MENGLNPESYLLARQARREYNTGKIISVVCPKCGIHLEMMTTGKGERSMVRCKCGYICDTEINL